MTQQQLEKRRAVTMQDLACKLEAEDWHGVADCAMDLREIDSALRVIHEFSADEFLAAYEKGVA